ncbi:MAG: hypothetical protein COB53_13395 [Elusimicrobia bacterium]|nr:MAG: hypothetical protein COB53_13395 [Elusimicrobiota bacterium]
MPKKRISIVINREFGDRDYSRYGVEMLSNYFDVWVLDCSKIVNGQEKNPFSKTDFSSETKFEKYVLFSSISEFVEHLKRYKNSFYLDLLGDRSFKELRLRRELKFEKVARMKLRIGELPILSGSETISARLERAFKRGGIFLKVFRFVMSKVIFRFFEPCVDIAVFSGEVCLDRYPGMAPNIIWAHSTDYQIYRKLKSENQGSKNRGRYAVFLDQNGPAHPDYQFHGNKPPVTEKKYYESMNRYFDAFEKSTGINVVIAAHPRSSPEIGRHWNNREFVLGETPSLVQEAELVFAHYSTAISFAVLWRKPLAQLTTNEYINSYRWDRFEAFATLLGMNVINVDEFNLAQVVDEKIFLVDEEIYADYESKFLRAPRSASKGMWTIVAEHLISYESAFG